LSGWTGAIGYGLRAYLARRIKKLGDAPYWGAHTARTQLGILRSLLSRAADTDFGRRHAFTRLASLPDEQILSAYRAEVAPGDWYSIKDLVARMREGGEPNVLWPERVDNFAQTSGTTSGDKYIPVSKAMLKSNYRASLDIFCHMQRAGISLPDLTEGKSLFLGGTTQLSENSHGVRTGDLSGIVVPLIRWPISAIYLPGKEVALMSDWPAKIEAMARQCVREDVRMMSGVPSWAGVLCDRVIELKREQDPRARTLKDVWPNFTVFVHGGVRYPPFERRFRQLWSGSPEGPDLPHRLELYPASEAFVAIQDVKGDPSLRLLVDNDVFFEFVPADEAHKPDARALACWEVEKGKRYVVTLTTCAGLWRYKLGDVVVFDSVPAPPNLDPRAARDFGPARLRIVGRSSHFIDAFGEKVIVEHVENAVARAARATGLTVGEFTAGPIYPGEGRRAGLELVVELVAGAPHTPPGPAALERFAVEFDEGIKEQNADYTVKRSGDLSMARPVVTPVPMGAFHRWMQSRGKLGGQNKCPRCANGRDYVEGVLKIAREAPAHAGVCPLGAALAPTPSAPPSALWSSRHPTAP
jgi:hypothetical protein